MICDNCRKAGRFNAEANRAYPECRRVLRQSAEGWHEMCMDLICTCQHVTGRVVRMDTANE